MAFAEMRGYIDATPKNIFAVLSDGRNNPKWELELREYVQLTSTPFGVGTKFAWVREFSGFRTKGELEITECVPGKKLVSASKVNGMAFESIVWLELQGKQTLVSVRLELRPSVLLSFLNPLLKKRLQHQGEMNLKALKNLVEQIH
ncbi:MAG: SRPBCC family protein [Trueperaceae bacterium]